MLFRSASWVGKTITIESAAIMLPVLTAPRWRTGFSVAWSPSSELDGGIRWKGAARAFTQERSLHTLSSGPDWVWSWNGSGRADPALPAGSSFLFRNGSVSERTLTFTRPY